MSLKLLNQIFMFTRYGLLGLCLQTLFFTMVFAEGGMAQQKSIKDIYVTVDWRSTELREAFAELEKKTDYQFTYNERVVDTYKKISISAKNISLYSVLMELSKDAGLRFKRIDNNIHVNVKTANKANQPAIEETLLVQKVSGKITDQNGTSLPGVNVIEKGTTNGTVSDIDGNYQLDVNEDATLLISFIGYKTVEVAVNGRSVIDIVIEEDVTALQEMVYTGYYSLPKERATGSFSLVNEEELQGVTSLSVQDQLEGIVPGLMFEPHFNTDNSGGATTSKSRGLVIRGKSSLGDNSPLYVVDGFPVIAEDGVDPLETIDPNNVKNITILKDAAAASLWGSAASNGVIVINTKDGSRVKGTSLNASFEYIAQPSPDLYDIPFTSSAESLDLYKSLFLDNNFNDGLQSAFNRAKYEFPEPIDLLIQFKAGEITEQEMNDRFAELSQTDVRDEFMDLFYQVESSKKINLAYNANTEGNVLRVSLMGVQTDGYAIGDANKQVIANITNQYKPTDWFSISLGVNAAISKREKNGVDIREINNIPQMSRILDDNGDYLPMIKNDYDDSYYDVSTQKRRDLVDMYDLPYDWDWNLKREIDNRDITENKTDLRLNTKITVTPFKGLDVDLSYQYQRNNSLESNYMNTETWYVRNSVNENARTDGTFPVPPGGILYNRHKGFVAHNGRFQLTYDNTIGNHGIRALAGMEIRKNNSEDYPYGFYGYDPQALTSLTGLNYADDVNPKLTGDNEWRGSIHPIPTLAKTSIYIRGREDAFVSFYGNFGYTFKEKYDLTGSIRLDKTNLYGRNPSYRDLPQWALGAGWTASDEDFFNVSFVDYLKLRIAYGYNGHVDKGAGSYLNGTIWVDPVINLPYASVQETPNPTLTWERTSNYNMGLDFALLGNKIKGTLELYTKKTDNVLTDITVNPAYGFYRDNATLNTGSITNNGFELDLSATVVNKRVKWQTAFNYSFNKNKADDIESPTKGMLSATRQAQYYPRSGQSVDYIAVAQWAGYNETGMGQVIYDGDTTAITDVSYGGAEIDKLFKFVGQRTPKHFGSFTNTVSYANFEFSVRLLYYFGHKFIKDSPASGLLSSYQSFRRFHTFNPGIMADRWQSPADSETASMYSIDTKITNFLSTLSVDYLSEYNTKQVLDAGHVRLQSISLAYNIPTKYLMGLRSAKIQVQARDLGPIFLKNDEGVDPQYPKYSSSLYTAFYNVIRDRPVYAISLKVGI